MPAPSNPTITKQDDVTVIVMGADCGGLDDEQLDELTGELLQVTDAADPPLVVLDLSQTKFFASTFIETIFRIWNRLNRRERGGFAISGLTPYCAEIISVTHLDRLWDVYDSSEEAVRSLLERRKDS